MERSFKGIWIPKEIWLNKELTLLEKVFLVEIDSLDNDKGCYASNEYFSKFFGLSKNRCTEIIKALEKKGFVKISYIYKKGTKLIDKRVVKVFYKSNTGVRNLEEGIRKTEEGVRNLDRGYSENREDNNTLLNNTFNNTTTIRDDVVDEIKKAFNSFDDKTIKLVADSFKRKGKDIDYLLEKIDITKKANTNNTAGYLISAITNDYKPSINNAKCFIPRQNRFNAGTNNNFMNYDPIELERMLQENQKGKFR